MNELLWSKKKQLCEGKNIFVYLHGGYWQWGTIKASSFMAENFVNKDFLVASVGYLLTPEGLRIRQKAF
jgi:acetyl esterase/lipase